MDESRRCTATSHGTGERCRRSAIRGGTVCRTHGGAAPQVQRKAAQRLAIMTGQEALERLSNHARADVWPAILGRNDPIAKLPLEVRICIRSVRPTKEGRVIELYDGQRATELLAKAGGALTDKVEHKLDQKLEDLLAGTYAKDAK